MLEQAVYAGRNHAFILAATLIAFAAFAALAAPARASDVARVGLGTSIEDLIVGPDGGAWVHIDRRSTTAIGRATPDGRFSTGTLEVLLSGGALGPDGLAWFQSERATFVRAGLDGKLTEVGRGDGFSPTFATGPDGTLWSPTPKQDGFAHLTPQGVTTITRGGLPKQCADGAILEAMARASDGAMWLSDQGCERLVRVAATGTSTITLPDGDPGELAADASGGMWATAGEALVHADAAGTLRTFDLPGAGRSPTDVAVAPDGSAWVAFGGCALARVDPAGPVTSVASPIPARRLAFDPSGGLWLASGARLVHLAPGERGGRCDGRPPAVRVTPAGRSRVATLRRGIAITLREPATVSAVALYYDTPNGWSGTSPFLEAIVRENRGRTLRYRVPAARLKRFERLLARGRRPHISFVVVAADAEGNVDADTTTITLRR